MNATELWTHIYDQQRGILGMFSSVRPEPASKRLESTRTAYVAWPSERERARAWIGHEAAVGRETYHCAHLLTARRRVKENAALVRALWVDGDGARATEDLPQPTAIIESSPGREQFYYRLTRAVAPEFAEAMNRRLAVTMGADKSGYDLTQLLRPPGTSNFKYPGAPPVRILELKDERYDPLELDRLLPPLPREEPKRAGRSDRPKVLGAAPELSRLSQKMQDLIRYGNRGEYESRSEADMAACVAMFGAGYSEAEVWAVMTNPTNGVSEKFFEKGRQGERYLALTIGKARARTDASPKYRGRVYARRKAGISVD